MSLPEPDLTGAAEIAPGLHKKVLTEAPADAPAPQAGEEVTVHYTGRLTDGKVFDSSLTRNKPFKFTLGAGQVIKGWDLGVATMKQGEKSLLTIASDLGYGAMGSPPTIPGGATLQFEVELLGSAKPPAACTSEERVAQAERRKGEGNRLVGKGDAALALDEYRLGLTYLEGAGLNEADPPVAAAAGKLIATLNNNAAMVCIKLARWREAFEHADKAVAAEPGNAKALFRRGTAQSHLGNWEEAKADLAAADKLAPGDAGVRAELDRVSKAIAAAKAKEKKAFGGFLSKGLNLYGEKSDVVDLSYKGPLPHAFFDVNIGGKPAGRIVFKLYQHIAPRTVANFLAICKGGNKDSTGKDMHYKDSIFHRIIPSFMAQFGDYQNGNGTGGESIHGRKFEDEANGLKVPHSKRGLLSMANAGPNTNGSQAFVTFVPTPHLDGKHVVFGEVVEGWDVLEALEAVKTAPGDNRPTDDNMPTVADCGALPSDYKPAAAAPAGGAGAAASE